MKALALVEHVDRELDLLCLVRMLLKREHGIDLNIANVSADAPALLHGEVPRIVFFSSFYSSEWQLRRDYVSAWPDAKVASLAWEQIFCPIDEYMHRPLDDFARRNVYYLAWSADYQDYLIRNGVEPRNIGIVGHSLYQLYDAPYSSYFKSRADLGWSFGLDWEKRWVLIAENYGFMFLKDDFIEILARGGIPKEALLDVRAYCRSSMAALARWTHALARSRDDVEVIFRPRPAVDADDLRRFFRDECGIRHPKFKFIKAETVREWVLACDVVLSSYSTVLIEAAVAGKTIGKVEPSPLPEHLRYDWVGLVYSIRSETEFLAATAPGHRDGGSARLRDWARERFFAAGKPIEQLVNKMAKLIREAHEPKTPAAKGPYVQRMPDWLSAIDGFLDSRSRDALYRKYVPGYTHLVKGHEKDFFDRSDVEERSQKWSTVLLSDRAADR